MTAARCAEAMRWMVRSMVLAASVLVPSIVLAQAAGTASEPFQATLHATASGIGPVRSGEPLQLTIHLRGADVRIDFDGAYGEDGYLLSHAGASRAWLVNPVANVALPVPAMARQVFRVDPHAPCADMGARCEPGQHEVVAGRLVRAWRYRDANGRGPDGTDRGVLWVEPDTGLVLGFRGRLAGREEVKELHVTSLSLTPVDAALFRLPRTLEQLDPRAPDARATY